MRTFLIVIVIVISNFFVSCRNNNYNDHSNQEEEEYIETNNDEEESSYNNAENEVEEEKFPDDTYCAEIKYYNPNTSTHSNYTLTVEVESNEVVQINFPNRGALDNDHFSGSELDENGSTNFSSDKGYEYTVRIIGSGDNCSTFYRSEAVQCIGSTKEGVRCENMTDNSNELCWMHQDQE